MKKENLYLEKLTTENAKEICTWAYTSPYDVFNWPCWEETIKAGEALADEEKREKNFCGVFDENDDFCGFVEFILTSNGIRLSLGLKPTLCGKGIGQKLMEIVIDEARKRTSSGEIDLEVLSWNERAFKTYLKSGFEVIDTYERKTPTGIATFHRMVLR